MIILTEKELKNLEGTYKHKTWFSKRDKTIKECIEYFAKEPDFNLDVISWTRLDNIKYFNFDGLIGREKATKFCIENNLFDRLRIKHSCDGSDKGILKVKYFIKCRLENNLSLFWEGKNV